MNNRKFETSKIFLYIVMFLSIGITIFSVIQMVKLQVLDPLCYLIPAIFTELTAATTGYYWKSKNENRIKMVLSAVKELSSFDELSENDVRLVEALINTLN